MTPLESWMLETIPIRISPPPSSELGPTEQLRIREAHRALWRGDFEAVGSTGCQERKGENG